VKKLDIKTGKRKSFGIKFVEVSAENIDEVATWCNGAVGGEGNDRFIRIVDKNAINTRQTKAFFGDFMVLSMDTNTFKCFGRKAFHKAFEPDPQSDGAVIAPEGATDATGGHVGIQVTEETAVVSAPTVVELPRDAGLDG
jgi:hypothetical protein